MLQSVTTNPSTSSVFFRADRCAVVDKTTFFNSPRTSDFNWRLAYTPSSPTARARLYSGQYFKAAEELRNRINWHNAKIQEAEKYIRIESKDSYYEEHREIQHRESLCDDLNELLPNDLFPHNEGLNTELLTLDFSRMAIYQKREGAGLEMYLKDLEDSRAELIQNKVKLVEILRNLRKEAIADIESQIKRYDAQIEKIEGENGYIALYEELKKVPHHIKTFVIALLELEGKQALVYHEKHGLEGYLLKLKEHRKVLSDELNKF